MDLATLEQLNAARRARRLAVVMTELDTGGTRLILEGDRFESDLGAELGQALRTGRSGLVERAGKPVFLNFHLPPPRLVVIGAVHISQALAPIAAVAGYPMEIVDPRTAFAAEARFAGVELHPNWPRDVFAGRPLDAYTALVALTHDPRIDDDALVAALEAGCFYVGALGSRKTHSRRVERLASRGMSPERLARIDAPVGLDIGAANPPEIAVAVLGAVIKAWRSRGSAEQGEPGRARTIPSQVDAVVLAAGSSSRMAGGNKLLARFDGAPLVGRVVERVLASRAAGTIVVTGHEAERVESAIEGLPVRILRNGDYASGLASSLRVGVAALPAATAGALILLADMPAIETAHLDRMILAFEQSGCQAVIRATNVGKPGNPVILPRTMFAQAESLAGDVGARHLIESSEARIVEVDIGPAASLDVDHAEALSAAGGVLP